MYIHAALHYPVYIQIASISHSPIHVSLVPDWIEMKIVASDHFEVYLSEILLAYPHCSLQIQLYEYSEIQYYM